MCEWGGGGGSVGGLAQKQREYKKKEGKRMNKSYLGTLETITQFHRHPSALSLHQHQRASLKGTFYGEKATCTEIIQQYSSVYVQKVLQSIFN